MKRNLLKTLFAGLFLSMLTPITAFADVTINSTNFPDANFRNWLLAKSYGQDGKITDAEIKDITSMFVSYENISSLKGIEYFTALTSLYCYGNQLTSLDVSKNTALEDLDCSDNKLTSLDVSQNTALTWLSCFSNQLTSLDVSQNTALTSLTCRYNQLTSLDVSHNTELTDLDCSYNQRTSLDVSHNTELTFLDCYYNQLTSLDVFKNTELGYLSCGYNQLSSLDVSHNTALIWLTCSDNRLISLDVSHNTALNWLSCGYNQLISLDVSHNTALEKLDCYFNQLSSLDVSNNMALKELYCGYNLLSSLDVSNNTVLNFLYCDYNLLSSLDVSHNTALNWLWCEYNQLTSLDVSHNTALKDLDCSGNKLTSLDVSQNTALTRLYCYRNQIRRIYMDAFIESLPNNATDKKLYIYCSTGDGNICTDSQAAAIKAKGWTPYCYNAKEEFEYEGIEDNGIHMGIISFNDKIYNLPITVLDQESEPMFIDFVDNMEMANATLLYYAVDQAITTLAKPEYPDNLSNAMIITFTDGLDQGSLAMAPEHLTSRNYAQYLSDRISSTKIQDVPLQAYTIGLKSEDVMDDELFEENLMALASDSTKSHSVTDIEGVQAELTKIYEELSRQTSQRVISINVPMMSHGDRYRFTLDGTTTVDKVEESELWIEGIFDITDYSLNDITYHGLTSTSGNKITAEREGISITFTFNDCRDEEGDILEIEKNAIDQWTYIASRDTWQHNVENDKDGNINIEDIYTSAAIMFVLDCSTSLGDLFPVLKQTANSFIDRLAGGDGDVTGIDNVTIDHEETDQNAPVEYYNLQGVKVATPGSGLYIRRQGNSVRKVMLK